MPDTHLPTSPPTPPVVAVGPSTVAGGGLTVTLLVAAVLDAIFGDQIDTDTRLLIAGGIATALVTIGGRMLQAGLARIGEGSQRPTSSTNPGQEADREADAVDPDWHEDALAESRATPDAPDA